MDESDELRDENAQLREENAQLRREARRDGDAMAGMRSDAAEASATIARLRAEADQAERELVDLRAVRDALTPPLPSARAGLTLAAHFVPAEPDLSGDFYVVADGADDAIVIAIGDVVGKGLTAARRAAFVRTAIVSVAPFADDPAQILELVNTALVERAGTSNEFVTAACLSYRPADRELRWAYAGHPPALSLRDGTTLAAASTGLPLGIADHVGCTSAHREIAPGDGILLMTDGLLEAMRDHELYGSERVGTLLREHPDATPADILARLADDALAFAGGPFRDDLCMVAARAS